MPDRNLTEEEKKRRRLEMAGQRPIDRANQSYTGSPPALQGQSLPINDQIRQKVAPYWQDVKTGAAKSLMGVMDMGAKLNQPHKYMSAADFQRPNLESPRNAVPLPETSLEQEKAKATQKPELAAAGDAPQGGALQPVRQNAPVSKPMGQAPPNRYQDMYFSGDMDAQQRFFDAMPENQRPVHLIRGTNESYFSPITGQEYASKLEAAHGVTHQDMMGKYGIDTPLQASMAEKKMGLTADGKSQPKFDVTKIATGDGLEEKVAVTGSDGIPRFYGPNDPPPPAPERIAFMQGLASKWHTLPENSQRDFLSNMSKEERSEFKTLIQQMIGQYGGAR